MSSRITVSLAKFARIGYASHEDTAMANKCNIAMVSMYRENATRQKTFENDVSFVKKK